MDASKYSTRLIALKFAYLGQRYNGFEYHANNNTSLPTVEEALWKALVKARLIFPTEPLSSKTGEVNWEGCEYSKCGRTDRGVSAFGQVIGIRVRSNRPLPRSPLKMIPKGSDVAATEEQESPSCDFDADSVASQSAWIASTAADQLPFHDVKDELHYMKILNNVLPPDIRVFAWCPAPPDFSARFSCRERRYRYFFTQPAFNPTPGPNNQNTNLGTDIPLKRRRREGWLDIEAMQDGAKRFEGVHDFRNFCKVDPSKQIAKFEREMFRSDIVEVASASEPSAYVSGHDFAEFHTPIPNGLSSASTEGNHHPTPRLYMFMLHGSGFLWHQVRHMVAILFLVGQGLESPDLVSRLLDVKENPEKPLYEMADDAPLVLWDCMFPAEGSESREDALPWIYAGDPLSSIADGVLTPPAKGNGKFGLGGVVDEVWKLWREKKMDEVLAGMLLNKVADMGNSPVNSGETGLAANVLERKTSSQKIFYGGNSARLKGRYVPVLQRPRMESVEIINAKYATRKGFEEDPALKDLGFRQVKLEKSLRESPQKQHFPEEVKAIESQYEIFGS